MGPKLLFVLGIIVAHGALGGRLGPPGGSQAAQLIATCVQSPDALPNFTPAATNCWPERKYRSPIAGRRSRERGHLHDGRPHYFRKHVRFARPSRTRTVEVVSDDEDAQLMLAYARGEMRAFETLYARHRGALYRYLTRQARDGEIANDLFQEVWSRVIVNRTRYEPRAKFRTFLFTLAHNCFIDHCRRTKARPAGLRIEDADDADLLPAAEEHAARFGAVEGRELRAGTARCSRRLPAEQRDVYLLHEESDLSLEDIARITGVGAETAKSRLRYAVANSRRRCPRRRPDMTGPDDEFDDFLIGANRCSAGARRNVRAACRARPRGAAPGARSHRIRTRGPASAARAGRCPLALAATLVLGFTVVFYAGLPQQNAPVPEVTVQNVAERVDMPPMEVPMQSCSGRCR